MTFEHEPVRSPVKLKRVNIEGKRYYDNGSGSVYPSVTSVTGLHNLDAIKAWRKKVGDEAATKISTQASNRGTQVHKLCEDYLNNVEDYTKGHMPSNVSIFNSMKRNLNLINNIRCQEMMLWSDYLKVSGTVDCVAEYNGRLSIIDFKTSRKRKYEMYCEHYFMQCAAYAVCFEEMFKRPISQLVLIIGVEEDESQVFVDHRDVHVSKFMTLREKYREMFNY